MSLLVGRSDDLVTAVYDDVVGEDPVRWAELDASAQRDRIIAATRERAPLLTSVELVDVVERVHARMTGFGPLDPLLAVDDVTEVMVNGDGRVWTERHGRIEPTSLVLDPGVVMHVLERIVTPLGRRIDRSSPVVDARLPNGSRVHAVIPPVAVDGPCVTIRRFGVRPVELERFCTGDVARLLDWAVRARYNVVVSGGTGAGKTTLLNALAASIPSTERIVTIEDTAELRLAASHVVRLEAREANAEGAGAVSVRELVRNALRMRPDRLVVGEVRSDEVVDMLQAMNTGHDGSLSTVHANSAEDALRRIDALVLAGGRALPLAVVRELVASSIDLVVHVRRTAAGCREIAGVHELRAPDNHAGVDLSGGLRRSVAAEEQPTAARTSLLARGDAVLALPVRTPRARVPVPSPRWLAP